MEKQQITVGKDNGGIYYKIYKKVDENHISNKFKDFIITTEFDEEKLQKLIKDIEKSKTSLSLIINGKSKN